MSPDCTTNRQVTPVFEISTNQSINSWIPIESLTITDQKNGFRGKVVLAPIINSTDQLGKLTINVSSKQSGDRELFSNQDSENRDPENRYQMTGNVSADIQRDSERSSEATVFGKNKFRKSSKNFKLSATVSKKKAEPNSPLQKIKSVAKGAFNIS